MTVGSIPFVWLPLQVFVLSQKNVKEKGYVTLFQYMTKNKKSLFARIVMSAPEVLQVITLTGTCPTRNTDAAMFESRCRLYTAAQVLQTDPCYHRWHDIC